MSYGYTGSDGATSRMPSFAVGIDEVVGVASAGMGMAKTAGDTSLTMGVVSATSGSLGAVSVEISGCMVCVRLSCL